MWLTGRAPQSIKSYRHDAKAFRAFINKPLPEVTLADVVRWIDSLQGVTQSYRARRLISIKSLMRFAHRAGYCIFDVAWVIRIPRTKRTTHKRLMEHEHALDMINAAGEGRDRTLIRFFLASGCRVSEAVGINFADLKDSSEPESVPTDERCGLVTFFGKNMKTRTVPVKQIVVDELRALRGTGDDDESPVFKSQSGRRLSVRTAQRITKAARTDEQKVSPHWFRHRHATEALNEGAEVWNLQHQLGHSSVSTTMVYVHLRQDQGTGAYIKV